MTDTNYGGFALRKAKTHEGREGIGLNADIHLNGRKVAHVLDDGNGGCFRYYWTDHDARRAFLAVAKAQHPDDVEPDDTLVNDLFARFEAERGAKRDLSRKIVVLVDGQLRTAKVQPTPAAVTAAVAQWPNARVLNAMPPAEAHAAYVDAFLASVAAVQS